MTDKSKKEDEPLDDPIGEMIADADQRKAGAKLMAEVLWEEFSCLHHEGFTREEAMELLVIKNFRMESDD